MNIEKTLESENQLIRLLQIGVVLEEIVETRSYKNYKSMLKEKKDIKNIEIAEIEEILKEAQTESADHRKRLEKLINKLNSDPVSFEKIEKIINEKYDNTKPENFKELLHDQLHGEKSAYKFYDDLIESINESEVKLSIDRQKLVNTLKDIREEEAEGVKEVNEVLKNKGWK